jgi:predicted enzyme related to lactoylglutathione lyase
MKYHLDGIVLRCRNVAELSRFYDNVMKLERFVPEPPEPVISVARYRGTGGVVFELLSAGPELGIPKDRQSVPTSPMFRVDDLVAAIRELTAAGVRWVTERQRMMGAPAEIASFLDPEGHHILIFEMKQS